MSNIYCGIKKLPKNKILGTEQQCAKKGQIRKYGEISVDPSVFLDKPKKKLNVKKIDKIISLLPKNIKKIDKKINLDIPLSILPKNDINLDIPLSILPKNNIDLPILPENNIYFDIPLPIVHKKNININSQLELFNNIGKMLLDYSNIVYNIQSKGTKLKVPSKYINAFINSYELLYSQYEQLKNTLDNLHIPHYDFDSLIIIP